MKINSAIIIGCGGTGSILIEPLIRLLMFHPNGTYNITIADGDEFEDKNSERQLFNQEHLGTNKALAMAARLTFAKGLIAIPEYISQKNLNKILRFAEPPILFIPAVDNAASRHLFLNQLDEQVDSYVWVCPGNDWDTASVSCYIKQDNITTFVHPFDRYNNLRSPDDHIPGGCAELTPSTPQLITANFMAANATMMIVSSLLYNQPIPGEINCSLPKFKVVSTGAVC